MGHDSITVERWHEVTWCQVSEHPIIPISPIFWVGVRNGVGEKIALILKGLPPSHHLIGKSHSITNDDVTCEGCGVSNGIVEYHIENSEIEMGSWAPNCLLLDLVGRFNASPTFVYHPSERFLLILICEGSQIFVWRNNAFIFFQKSDIINDAPHE